MRIVNDDWDISDEQMDAWAAEWEAVDRAAAEYLAQRIPEVLEPLTEAEKAWLDELVETFSPTDEPDVEIEEFSSVMALDHADWLGLALGVVRRGVGSTLDAETVFADVVALEDVEGEIEDPEGTIGVIDMALLVLAPLWQELGVLDPDERLTERGVWGLPRALHRDWLR